MGQITPIISISMCIYNTLPVCSSSIDAVLQNTDVPYELILVYNHPPYTNIEPHLQYLQRMNKEIHIIDEGINLGCHKGMNKGFERAKGKYLVKIDDDTIVPPKWASQMVECLEKNEYLPYLTANCTARQNNDYHVVYHDNGQITEEIWADEGGCVNFPCVMFRRETWETWDKFEADSLYGGEENWYKDQARWRGLKIGLLTDVKCIHQGEANGVPERYRLWKYDYGYAGTYKKDFREYMNEK